jgi:hypothetical protein
VITSLGVIELCQPIRVEPDPQGIVQRSEKRCLTDPFYPSYRINEIDRGVVAQVDGVVGLVRRIKVDHLKKGSGFLPNGEAGAGHLLRQLGHGEARTVLHVDSVNVRVGAQRKRHGEDVAAIGPAGGLIIECIVDAVDLLFDGLGDRGFDHFGIGTRISRVERYLRRHDIGKLRDRDRRDGNDASECNNDRDDESEPRPLDENTGEHSLRFRAGRSP